MGKRRKARELGMQAIFSMDLGRNLKPEQFEFFCQNFSPPSGVRDFFEKLVKGVLNNWDMINSLIERFSSNWKVNRMAVVDRNIMRIAIYEMMFCSDIPLKVSINEAIDISKKFGTEESGAFINGILDSIRMAIESGEIQTDWVEIQTNP